MSDVFYIPTNEPKSEKTQNRWEKPEAIEPPQPGGESGSFTIPANEKISVGQDVAKTAASEAKYIPGDVIGTPGSLGEMFDIGKANVASLPIRAGEGLGYYPEGSTKKANEEMYKDMGVGSGVNYIGGLPFPTAQGMEKITEKVTPESWKHEPQYEESKLTGAGVRFGGNMAATGALGVLADAPRAVELGKTVFDVAKEGLSKTAKEGAKGVVAGVTSEGVGSALEGMGLDKYSPYGRLVGGVIGLSGVSALGNGINALTNKNGVANEKILQALALDMKNGEGITAEDYQKMVAAGYSPSVYEMGGAQTRKLLNKMGYDADTIKKFNDQLTKRNNSLTSDFNAYLEGPNGFGTKLDAAADSEAVKIARDMQTSKIYKFAENSPSAQAINSPELRSMEGIADVKASMKEAEKVATDPATGIRPPQYTPAQPPSPTGLLDINGKPIMNAGTPEKYTPANLQYWDQVKRNLDDRIKAAGSSTDEGRRLVKLKDRLVTELDKRVTGYDDARNSAFDKYQTTNAIEAGYESAKNMDSYARMDFEKLINKLDPKQKEMLAQGQGAWIKDTITEKGPGGFIDFLNKKPFAAERLKMGLGEKRFNEVVDQARIRQLLGDAQTITAHSMEGNVGKTGLGAAVLQGVGELGYSAASGQFPSLGSALRVFGVAVMGMAGKGTLNFAQRRVADEVVKLASSSNPKDIARLTELARTSYPVASLFDQFSKMANTTALVNLRANPNYGGDREGRKEGGRVVNGVAEKLYRELTRNKKIISNHTEQMLAMPDDAIVQALHTAKNSAM